MKYRKFFNTSGPCVAEDHYMLDPLRRFENIESLIWEKKYFILHAPRQTGKTTAMLEFVHRLNAKGEVIALYCNIEAAQPLRNRVEAVNKVIIGSLCSHANFFLPPELRPPHEVYSMPASETMVFDALRLWSEAASKPLVLLIDEADALIGDGLISLLRQLRAGYNMRPKGFPMALGLIGIRDLRDYRITASDGAIITGGSAFNIKDESLTLTNFTQQDVIELYQQHTEATGQQFTPAALQMIFHKTQGQPWLVNALGKQLCTGLTPIVPEGTVTVEHVITAVEKLILRRDVHLDQLSDKLSQPRVAPVIQSILLGEQHPPDDISNEEMQYIVDLGLIRKSPRGWEIANPIYQEVIPRELTYIQQESFALESKWYVLTNGKLNIGKVFDEFIRFYKQHAEMMTTRKQYTEAAHHLLFMAWLQRIVNGGGRIEREYASGMGRMDLLIEFAGERFAIEMKLQSRYALETGLEQLTGYLQRLSLQKGWLLLFHRGKIEEVENLGERQYFEREGKSIEVITI